MEKRVRTDTAPLTTNDHGLETPRLVIRTFEPRDTEAWLAMLADPEVRRFLPPGPAPTIEDFQRAIEARHAMEREGGYAMWAVDEKKPAPSSASAACGRLTACGLRPGSRRSRSRALGESSIWRVTSPGARWNKGHATEAAIAVLTHGLGPLGLDCILAVAMPENTGSWRVMEKAGMRYVGLADYYGLEGLKKYIAEPEWWRPPATI